MPVKPPVSTRHDGVENGQTSTIPDREDSVLVFFTCGHILIVLTQQRSKFQCRMVILSLLPAQCRAARALIGWSLDELSSASKIAKETIADFEAGILSPPERILQDMKRSFETAGVLFILENGGGAGVRLAKRANASIDTNETETVQYEEHLKNDAPPGAGG